MSKRDKRDNGKPPPQQPQMDEVAARELAHMAAMTAQVLRGFAPHLTDEQALMLSQQAIIEGNALAPVLEHAVPGTEEFEKHPRWGIRVTRVVDNMTGVIVAPKQITAETPMDQVMHSVNVIALATSVVGRALLRAWGYKLDFFQTGPEQPTILQPGD